MGKERKSIAMIGTKIPWQQAGQLSLVYGESVMATLHLWILAGGVLLPLPSAEKVMGQHWILTYVYLISDMMLPIAVYLSVCVLWAGSNTRNNWKYELILAAHTVSYLLFLCCSESLEPVMEWAYIRWPERIQLHKDGGLKSLLPAIAVLIDVISHSGGLYFAYKHWKKGYLDNIHAHPGTTRTGISRMPRNEVDGGIQVINDRNKNIAVALGVAVASISMQFLSNRK